MLAGTSHMLSKYSPPEPWLPHPKGRAQYGGDLGDVVGIGLNAGWWG